ncbi:MAG: type IV toxin-antitoxin system AbiEi family antitoxin domain-containing protein, partial [Dehalococcoidales bacterium]|nr:type IV toxin-antitoxin system AbiEi family antitoxin domain-containing protein [Dehalococcoidales bacterium]
KDDSYSKAIEVFKSSGGVMRISEGIKRGINPKTIYVLLERGVIERIGKGLYRLVDMPDLSNPDLVIVAKKIPDGVVCLLSALQHHGMTTHIPKVVDVALPERHHAPKIKHPPVKIVRFSEESFKTGVDEVAIDGVIVKIFNPAKTIADCFKFRNRIGIDIAVEALRSGYKQKKATPADILKYARICRVEKIIRPYLEALL